MLTINAGGLTVAAQTEMARHTITISGKPTYPEKVEEAKRLWRNRAPATLFTELKDALKVMCHSVQRCMYCEDNQADEIEHRRPKTIYPAETFVWDNLLYACGTCNGPKNNNYGVLNPPYTNGPTRITRKRKAVPTVPPNGQDALIDPRHEDPMDFMQLDFNTYRFAPINPSPAAIEHQKALYTIEILELNNRDVLVRNRELFYQIYEDKLAKYVQERGQMTQAQKDEVRDEFKCLAHRTVWEEMKRQRGSYPNLNVLFVNAPETLAW